jgi:hypothetical protein
MKMKKEKETNQFTLRSVPSILRSHSVVLKKDYIKLSGNQHHHTSSQASPSLCPETAD